MAIVKFYRGKESSYDSTKYLDGIYFATDTQKIILNGVAYGGISEDSFNAIIEQVSNYTVNAKLISTNPVLSGLDIILTDYVKPDNGSAIEDTDSTNIAIGKLEANLDFVQEVLFSQYTSASLKSSISIFEADVLVNPTLTIGVTFNGKSVTPDSLSLKKAGTVVVTDNTTKTWVDSTGITSTTKYELTVTYKGVVKTASVNVPGYYAMYMGGSPVTTMTETVALSLNKQSIKSSSAGSYSFPVETNDYAWFVIPSTFTINKMTSSGFDVPLTGPTTLTINGVSYKAYKTASALVEGTMSVVIS